MSLIVADLYFGDKFTALKKIKNIWYNELVNKFYILTFFIIFCVFAGIFYLTQKDSLINGVFIQNPTPIFPIESSNLELKSPSPMQDKVNDAFRADPQQQQTQSTAPTFGVEEGVKASYSAILKTSKGNIEMTLFGEYAPRTVKNFVSKAEGGYYKDLLFHRVEDWVIQGGDPKGNGTGGGLMQTELNKLHFEEGSLGVARGGDIRISNDSQFFITKSDAAWLDGSYTNFGIVTSGMDVVKKMEIGDKILGIEIE